MHDEGREKNEKLKRFLLRAAGVGTEILESENQWDNVTGHCLIEAARACVFAELLGFDAELKKDLVLAALLHDGHKKEEMEAIEKELQDGGSGYVASNTAMEKYSEGLQSKGISARVIKFISFVGGMPDALFAVRGVLNANSLGNEELGLLIVQYLDAYARGSAWVEPADSNGNDIDRRMKKNRENAKYTKINAEASKILQQKPFFAGMDSFGAMAGLGHEIEKKLAQYIGVKSGKNTEPLKIPEMVDAELRVRLV